ncbi:hypothetical protein MAR_026045 [Mya arenaria]|uniref:Uncharacterized protein n=1 Tax=Mya arenaria TaxID=6604 RepID=A0ABY7EPT3_MYAAR|nr:hypothetical protein MAR_026045 [Mya arenaria]
MANLEVDMRGRLFNRPKFNCGIAEYIVAGRLVVFSDESKFNVNNADGRMTIYLRYYVKQLRKETLGGSVMIWGAINLLVICDANRNANLYISQILTPTCSKHDVGYIDVRPVLPLYKSLRQHSSKSKMVFDAGYIELYFDNAISIQEGIAKRGEHTWY